MKINVGTKNPVKIKAVKDAFGHYFENFDVVSVEVDSGIHNQPKSLKETVAGAKNRAVFSFKNCDYSVGLESGIFPFPETKTGYMNITVTVIYDGKNFFMGASPCFEYPKKVIEKIFNEGKEVSDIFDELFGTENLKHKQGAIGLFTRNKIQRDKYTELSIIMALCRIIGKDFYR